MKQGGKKQANMILGTKSSIVQRLCTYLLFIHMKNERRKLCMEAFMDGDFNYLA